MGHHISPYLLSEIVPMRLLPNAYLLSCEVLYVLKVYPSNLLSPFQVLNQTSPFWSCKMLITLPWARPSLTEKCLTWQIGWAAILIAIVRRRNKVWSRFIVVTLMFIAKINKTMQNGKSDKWFERIILVFSYFFLFILYSIDLYVVFWTKIRE